MRVTGLGLLLGALVVSGCGSIGAPPDATTGPPSAQSAPASTSSSAAPIRPATASPLPPRPVDQPTLWLCRPGMADNPCEGGLDATVIDADGTDSLRALRARRRPAGRLLLRVPDGVGGHLRQRAPGGHRRRGPHGPRAGGTVRRVVPAVRADLPAGHPPRPGQRGAHEGPGPRPGVRRRALGVQRLPEHRERWPAVRPDRPLAGCHRPDRPDPARDRRRPAAAQPAALRPAARRFGDGRAGLGCRGDASSTSRPAAHRSRQAASWRTSPTPGLPRPTGSSGAPPPPVRRCASTPASSSAAASAWRPTSRPPTW